MADKKIAWTRVTADRKLLSGPGWIHAIIITPSAAAATCVIRDGVDSNGDDVLDLGCQSQDTLPLFFQEPMYLKKGLFVDWGANTTSVTIGYKAE